MRPRKRNNSPGGFLLLLLLLVALTVMKGNFSLAGTEGACCEEKVFVQISGHVVQPGVYGFCEPPDLKALLGRAGGLTSERETVRTPTGVFFNSGAVMDVRCRGKSLHIFQGEMSAFQMMTFGMPVSLNRETREGLTAIPGIGPGLAKAIVRERTGRGGFQALDEILSVPGIGPALYRKISPYLAL